MPGERTPLAVYLSRWQGADGERAGSAAAIAAIADSGIAIADRIARGAIDEDPATLVGQSEDGDGQKLLDRWSNDVLVDALRGAGVRAVASEELAEPLDLGGAQPIVVAFDPLDGSSNIATNVSIGTIFSILPARDRGSSGHFVQPGSAQIAAGYILYGPHTALVLTVGDGTQSFVLDPVSRRFLLTEIDMRIPVTSREYAINGSNYRHWSAQMRAYVDDCIAGREGPREIDTNTRWIASMVAEAHRILVRGGVYLYPRDMRPGYEKGRLRLLYEAAPIAFLIEQAGGKAFDGHRRILDIVPAAIHERVPLIFGSAGEVDRIARYKSDPGKVVGRAPLFHRRGLFKV